MPNVLVKPVIMLVGLQLDLSAVSPRGAEAAQTIIHAHHPDRFREPIEGGDSTSLGAGPCHDALDRPDSRALIMAEAWP